MTNQLASLEQRDYFYLDPFSSVNLGTYVWVIDQAWGQDDWILAKFVFCVFMDRDEVEVHKHAKKERGQYPVILTEQSWSIKDLLYDLKHQKMIFDLAGPSEKSRAGSIAPSCPLG